MLGRRSVGDFSGAFRVGGRDWAVEDGVAEVGDEGLALATDLHEVSVVVDPDTAEEGGEELAFHGTGGCTKEGARSGHEVEVAQDHFGALLEGLGGGVEAGADFVFLDLEVA